MEALGKIGNFYIVLLFVFLIAGTGILSLNFSRKIWSSTESLLDKKGGKLMNKWLKLAVVAFAGLLVASFALGLTNSMTGGSTGNMSGMSGMTGGSADGSSGASAHNHGANQPGGQQSGNGASAASTGYAQGMNNPGVEAQMYMMQYQIQQLQQQLSHMQQMYNQQGYYPGPMFMPGYQNQIPSPGINNMNNMGNSNSSMGNQSSSGGNSGGGMGMM